jgi:hypothetical protein
MCQCLNLPSAVMGSSWGNRGGAHLSAGEGTIRRKLHATMSTANFLLSVSFPATSTAGAAFLGAQNFRTKLETQGVQTLSNGAYTVQSVSTVSLNLLDPTTQALLPSPPPQVRLLHVAPSRWESHPPHLLQINY